MAGAIWFDGEWRRGEWCPCCGRNCIEGVDRAHGGRCKRCPFRIETEEKQAQEARAAQEVKL